MYYLSSIPKKMTLLHCNLGVIVSCDCNVTSDVFVFIYGGFPVWICVVYPAADVTVSEVKGLD